MCMKFRSVVVLNFQQRSKISADLARKAWRRCLAGAEWLGGIVRLCAVRSRARPEGLTSLKRPQSDVRRLLDLVCGHGGKENGSNRVRDVTLGEASCRVRMCNAPQVLAGVRNAAVHLFKGAANPSKAAATRHFHIHTGDALPLPFT
jgi:hypothetical protein